MGQRDVTGDVRGMGGRGRILLGCPAPVHTSPGWVRNSSSPPQKYSGTPVPVSALSAGCIWDPHPQAWGGI